MTGRPPLLESDPKAVEDFLVLVRGGISPSNAVAEIPGLAWSTIMDWQKRGREAAAVEAEGGRELTDRERLYMDFSDKLQRARRRRVLRLEQTLIEKLKEEGASARDVMAALARLDPENWGDPEKRVRIEHGGSIDTTGEGSRLAAKIEDYEASFAALEDPDPS